MFIAMNRFRVRPGKAAEFEALWLNRDSHLKDVPGFGTFHMLKGPEEDGVILYSSHTTWDSRAAFEDWTRSEAFRAAHAGAGGQRDLYDGPPKFEGFETIQTISA